MLRIHPSVTRLIIALGTLWGGTPTRADDKPLRAIIDAELQAAWDREKIAPAGKADDATFLRRVYLDLVGTIPTYEETVQFLKDTSKDKRTKLIDKLLDDPRYAQQQAAVWDQVFLGRRPNNEVATRRNTFRAWLVDQFSQNVPYDRLVHELVLADGAKDGPQLFHLQFRAKPDEAAMAVSRIMLGTQLQCAQCHDDRREKKWTQLDFYGFAAFFARLTVVDGVVIEGKGRPWIAEKNAGEMMFTGPGVDQQAGKKGTAVAAKYLGGTVLEEPVLPKDFREPARKGNQPPEKPAFSRREKLADWLVDHDNPYFARAAVNRIFAQFLGRGLVHPVDDLRDRNLPSHPRLFEVLAEEFCKHQFDVKWLVREIVNSQAYQQVPAKNDDRPELFHQARVRPLTSEEMAAAIREATGLNSANRAAGAKPNPDADFFVLRAFGDAETPSGEFQANIHERLFVNNNGRLRDLLARRKGNLHDVVLTSPAPWEERVDRLFMTVLTRLPRVEERALFVEHLTANPQNAAPAVEEAIWVLLSCSEFRFNR